MVKWTRLAFSTYAEINGIKSWIVNASAGIWYLAAIEEIDAVMEFERNCQLYEAP